LEGSYDEAHNPTRALIPEVLEFTAANTLPVVAINPQEITAVEMWQLTT